MLSTKQPVFTLYIHIFHTCVIVLNCILVLGYLGLILYSFVTSTFLNEHINFSLPPIWENHKWILIWSGIGSIIFILTWLSVSLNMAQFAFARLTVSKVTKKFNLKNSFVVAYQMHLASNWFLSFLLLLTSIIFGLWIMLFIYFRVIALSTRIEALKLLDLKFLQILFTQIANIYKNICLADETWFLFSVLFFVLVIVIVHIYVFVILIRSGYLLIQKKYPLIFTGLQIISFISSSLTHAFVFGMSLVYWCDFEFTNRSLIEWILFILGLRVFIYFWWIRYSVKHYFWWNMFSFVVLIVGLILLWCSSATLLLSNGKLNDTLLAVLIPEIWAGALTKKGLGFETGLNFSLHDKKISAFKIDVIKQLMLIQNQIQHYWQYFVQILNENFINQLTNLYFLIFPIIENDELVLPNVYLAKGNRDGQKRISFEVSKPVESLFENLDCKEGLTQLQEALIDNPNYYLLYKGESLIYDFFMNRNIDLVNELKGTPTQQVTALAAFASFKIGYSPIPAVEHLRQRINEVLTTDIDKLPIEEDSTLRASKLTQKVVTYHVCIENCLLKEEIKQLSEKPIFNVEMEQIIQDKILFSALDDNQGAKYNSDKAFKGVICSKVAKQVTTQMLFEHFKRLNISDLTATRALMRTAVSISTETTVFNPLPWDKDERLTACVKLVIADRDYNIKQCDNALTYLNYLSENSHSKQVKESALVLISDVNGEMARIQSERKTPRHLALIITQDNGKTSSTLSISTLTSSPVLANNINSSNFWLATQSASDEPGERIKLQYNTLLPFSKAFRDGKDTYATLDKIVPKRFCISLLDPDVRKTLSLNVQKAYEEIMSPKMFNVIIYMYIDGFTRERSELQMAGSSITPRVILQDISLAGRTLPSNPPHTLWDSRCLIKSTLTPRATVPVSTNAATAINSDLLASNLNLLTSTNATTSMNRIPSNIASSPLPPQVSVNSNDPTTKGKEKGDEAMSEGIILPELTGTTTQFNSYYPISSKKRIIDAFVQKTEKAYENKQSQQDKLTLQKASDTIPTNSEQTAKISELPATNVTRFTVSQIPNEEAISNLISSTTKLVLRGENSNTKKLADRKLTYGNVLLNFFRRKGK